MIHIPLYSLAVIYVCSPPLPVCSIAARLLTIYCVLPTKLSTQLPHHQGHTIYSNVEDRRLRHCSPSPSPEAIDNGQRKGVFGSSVERWWWHEGKSKNTHQLAHHSSCREPKRVEDRPGGVSLLLVIFWTRKITPRFSATPLPLRKVIDHYILLLARDPLTNAPPQQSAVHALHLKLLEKPILSRALNAFDYYPCLEVMHGQRTQRNPQGCP